MDIKKWNALLAAVEAGSFNKAAEQLGYTQSGLTYMMKSLEEEVGFQLLHRSWDGIRLTEQGQQLLPGIRALCECASGLQRQIEELSGRLEQHISICTYPSISLYWLPDILTSFRKHHPGVEIEIRVGKQSELKKWLEEGEVMFSISDRLDVPKTEWIPLYDDPIMAAIPPDHPAAGKETVGREDLEKMPILLPSNREYVTALYSTLGKRLEDLGVSSQQMRKYREHTVQVETDDDAVLLAMVAKGLGICMLPELSVRDRAGNAAIRPFSPPVSRKLGIQMRREKQTETSWQMITLLREKLEKDQ